MLYIPTSVGFIDGSVPERTKQVLQLIKTQQSGILGIVSGRNLEFLKNVNERLGNVFSFLVAENGAIAYFSDSRTFEAKGKEWSIFARSVFKNREVAVRFFEIIASSARENTDKITKILKDSRLDSKLVPNKDSIMICPPGVDKGSSVAETVAHYGPTSQILLTCFGDGENDIALFGPADIRVAVSNAVPELKKIADYVTTMPAGLGVEEYLRKHILEQSLDSKG